MALASGAIIGVGDRKSGVQEVPCAILEQTAPPSTSQTRAGTLKFAELAWNFRRWAIVLRLYLSALLTLASAQ